MNLRSVICFHRNTLHFSHLYIISKLDTNLKYGGCCWWWYLLSVFSLIELEFGLYAQ